LASYGYLAVGERVKKHVRYERDNAISHGIREADVVKGLEASIFRGRYVDRPEISRRFDRS
jgi:hypothetical protein